MRQIGDSYVAAGAIVTGDVILSAGVNIWFGCVLRGDLARITLGPRVNLQDGCIVHTDFGEDQLVEEGVVVGHRAVLHAPAQRATARARTLGGSGFAVRCQAAPRRPRQPRRPTDWARSAWSTHR